MNQKIVIFWHICQLEHWIEVVKEQINTLKTSGLYDRCDNIYIGFLGKRIEIDWVIYELHDKASVIEHSTFLKHYERITINALSDYCHGIKNPYPTEQEEYILYIHSKGLTRGKNNNNVRRWRQFMEFFLIENYFYD